MAVREFEKQRADKRTTPEPSPVPKPVVTFFAFLRDIFGRAEDKRETMYDPPEVADEATWHLCMNVEPDELDGGFVAECLDVPGAMAQGETEQEALRNLIDAVQAVVAAKMEEKFEAIDFNVQDISPTKRKISVTF